MTLEASKTEYDKPFAYSEELEESCQGSVN